MRHFKNTVLLAAWLAFPLHAPAARAQDAGLDPAVDAGASDRELEIGDGDDVARFADRQLLIDAFPGDAPDRLANAEHDVRIAQANLDATIAGEWATPEEIADLEAKLRETQSARTAIRDQIQAVTDRVALLNDEQVFALNRSLDNARASGRALTRNTNLLQRVIDGNYNARQINALTHGLKQEARFLAKRNRFEALAVETGDGSFYDQAERMEKTAALEKEKFLARIDDFAAVEPTGGEASLDAATSAARVGAR